MTPQSFLGQCVNVTIFEGSVSVTTCSEAAITCRCHKPHALHAITCRCHKPHALFSSTPPPWTLDRVI